MRGLVVGIDPAGSRAAQPEAGGYDDLSLLTANYLYNLILSAGGTPVLTRADHSPAADTGQTALGRRVRVVRDAGCALCVSIRYEGSAQGVAIHVVRDGGAEADRANALLAECLRSSLSAEVIELDNPPSGDIAFLQALHVAGAPGAIPVCEVRFGCPRRVSAGDMQNRVVCLDNARRLYAGLSRFRVESAGKPDQETDREAGTAGALASSPIPATPTADIKVRLSSLGRSLWPAGRLPDDRVEWFCRTFARVSITNQSLVCFAVSASVENGVVVLRGSTNAPPLIAGLEDALRAVGLEQIRNQIRLLPDEDRLGEHLFGVCRVPTALAFDRPDESGGLQTQLLFGEPLFLLDRANGYFLLHAGDGYWGWVRRESIQPMMVAAFDEYTRHPGGVVLRDIDRGRVRIPRGAKVPVVEAEGDARAILLPDASRIALPSVAVAMDPGQADQAARRVRAALDLLYTPYLFGGRSPLGLDCSGLVANVWARSGDEAARDAWQQAFAGSLVATRWHRDGIRAGDQVFFIEATGRIYHTGLAINATHVVHAAPPYVQIGSLNPGDRLYDPRLDRDFFMAKRP